MMINHRIPPPRRIPASLRSPSPHVGTTSLAGIEVTHCGRRVSRELASTMSGCTTSYGNIHLDIPQLKQMMMMCAHQQMFSSTRPLQCTSSSQYRCHTNNNDHITALDRLSAAEANVLELELIIKCLKESIGKKRNLTRREYRAVMKNADRRINQAYVRVVTTTTPFSVMKADTELAVIKQELETADLKLSEKMEDVRTTQTNLHHLDSHDAKPMECNTITSSPPVIPLPAPGFQMNDDIITGQFHHHHHHRRGGGVKKSHHHHHLMGALPNNYSKEVEVVNITNSYFEDIDSLCVRMRYYPPLWEDIKRNLTSSSSHRRSGHDLTIVVGQPGIGKSVGFGNYCVLRCMKDLPKTIIIVISVETVNVLVPLGKDWKQFTVFTSAIRSLSFELCALIETLDVSDHRALVVHDIKSAKGVKALAFQDGFLRPLGKLVARVHTVVLTSPQQSNYGLALKAGVATRKYLPVWSIDELECTKMFDVKSKYEFCGGVPRSYSNTINDVRKGHKDAISHFNPVKMNDTLRCLHSSSELVQLDIGPHFDQIAGLSPVSMSAERLLRQHHYGQLSQYYHNRVQHSTGIAKGLELEKWFMFWIRGSVKTAITFDIEALSNVGEKKTLTIHPKYCIQVGGHTFKAMCDAAEKCNLKVGQSVLVQPKSTNFPVVDLLHFTKVRKGGVSWEVDVFQVTVASSHSPKAAPARTFTRCFTRRQYRRKLCHFIWVGLSAIPGAACTDSNGVTSTQRVSTTTPFFTKKQYRLDMVQALVPAQVASNRVDTLVANPSRKYM